MSIPKNDFDIKKRILPEDIIRSNLSLLLEQNVDETFIEDELNKFFNLEKEGRERFLSELAESNFPREYKNSFGSLLKASEKIYEVEVDKALDSGVSDPAAHGEAMDKIFDIIKGNKLSGLEPSLIKQAAKLAEGSFVKSESQFAAQVNNSGVQKTESELELPVC